MKTILIFLLLTSSLVTAGPLLLIDENGRSTLASVVSKDGAWITIAKEDGPEFIIGLDTLSEASRSMVLRVVEEEGLEKTIVVKNTVIKKVGGKFRYFFHYTNQTGDWWKGKIEVTLLNKMEGVINGQETFAVASAIPPGGAQVFYLDARTGPESVHGDAAVEAFEYRHLSGDFRSKAIRKPLASKFLGF